MATYQTQVDALLLAIFTAENNGTLSKTLANNRDAEMHEAQFAEDFMQEFIAGVRDSGTYNGPAVLRRLKGRLEKMLKEALTK